MTRRIHPRLPALVLLGVALALGCSQRPTKTDDPSGAEGATVIGPRARFNTAFPPADPPDKPRVHTLFLSADGTRLAASNSSLTKPVIQLWDVSGPPRKLHDYPGQVVALSPDGRRLVRWGEAGDLEVVDAEGGQVLGTLQYTGDHVYFRSPDVIVAMSQSHDWSRAQKFHVRQYDAATGKDLGSFEASDDDRVHICAPVKGGRELVLGVVKANQIKVWDLTTRRLVREFPLTPPRSAGSWSGFLASPDGTWLAFERGGTPTEVFDGTTGSVVTTLPRGLGPYNSAFVPGRDVYLAPSNLARAVKTGPRHDIVAYDLQRRAVVAAFRGHEKSYLEVAVSADGRVMATGDEAGDVLLWDLGQLQ
jgi:WD40 repeat protein